MKIRAIALSALIPAMIAVMISGCSVKFGTNTRPDDSAIVASPTAEAAKDREDMKITYGDFRKEYLYQLKAAGITDDSDESTAEKCAAIRSQVITYLINEKICYDKAAGLGIDKLSSEEMDEVEKEFDEKIAENVAYFGENANYGTLETGEVISDEDKERRGNEEFDAFLAECSLTRDDLLMWQVSERMTQNLADEVTKDISVEQSEAEAEYGKYVDAIKQLYEDDKEEYERGSYNVFWIPDGARRIKHILVSFDDSTLNEIKSARSNGDDAGADKLRGEKAEELDEKVTEIINMLDNGADFDELLQEYSGDLSGSELNPDGYLVVPDSVTFMKEFTEAAFALENVGDYRTAVTDYGVHVVLYASDAEVTQESKDEHIEYFLNMLTTNAKNERFNKILEEWRDEYAYETDYETLKIDPPAETAESGNDR